MEYSFSIKDEVENLKLIRAELIDAGFYTDEFAIALYLGLINKERNYIASKDY
jgi:hypothetical protein